MNKEPSETKPPQYTEKDPEYDFSKGMRGKYFDRYREGTNLALLDPDIRAAFPTDEIVNQVLRAALAQRKEAP